MANNPFKTSEFQKLKTEWNQKLKESGFEDAEDFNLPDPALKVWHSFRFFKSDTDQYIKTVKQREDYFSLASGLLFNGFPFETDVSRRVWELHCQGLSIRKIERILRHQLIGYKGCRRDRIHHVITQIHKRSGIKVK